MRNLQKVAKECLKELDAIGIQYGTITEFVINTRAMKRWGQCKCVPGGYSINISIRLLDEATPISALKNTIIHEILHTCKDGFCHTGEWKRLADKVNKQYGYGIKRCSTPEEKGVQRTASSPVRIKHRFICKDCGMVVDRTRESRFTKNYHSYRCAACGGKFTKEF